MVEKNLLSTVISFILGILLFIGIMIQVTRMRRYMPAAHAIMLKNNEAGK